MVLSSSLHNISLKTDTGLPLEPIGSFRCQTLPRPSLRDKDKEEIEGGKGEILGPQKRRKRQEVFDIEVSTREKTRCAESSKVPRATLEVGEGSGIYVASLQGRLPSFPTYV